VSEVKGRLHRVHHVAKKNLIANTFRSKDYCGKVTEVMTIEVGDKVLIYDGNCGGVDLEN
jgi:hypothetical protein